MARFQLSNRRFVHVGAATLVVAAGAGLASITLVSREGSDSDPTRRGPARMLTVTEARIEAVPGPGGATALRLVVQGQTNLVDGSQLQVGVLANEQPVEELGATVRAGQFDLQAPAKGEVAEGRYTVLVTFALERQSEDVRRALSYQPRSLVARATLALPLAVEPAADAKRELRAIFDSLNQAPRDPRVLDDLDRRAQAVGDHLWIAQEKAAIVKLRLAVEEARRPVLRRPDFDRLLVEAHVLAGL